MCYYVSLDVITVIRWY